MTSGARTTTMTQANIEPTRYWLTSQKAILNRSFRFFCVQSCPTKRSATAASRSRRGPSAWSSRSSASRRWRRSTPPSRSGFKSSSSPCQFECNTGKWCLGIRVGMFGLALLGALKFFFLTVNCSMPLLSLNLTKLGPGKLRLTFGIVWHSGMCPLSSTSARWSLILLNKLL